MLQVVTAENLRRNDSSAIFSDSDSRYEATITSSNNFEYFNMVEAGQVPNLPIASAGLVANVRNSNGETLLIVAARCGHANVVEHLLTEIDVEETDHDGWTALLDAAHHGYPKVAKLLLDAGAGVDQPDLMGWTPLMWACYKNHPEVVEVLLTAKAHINIVGEEDGLTPLIIASGRGYTEVVRKLLAGGAQVNTSDKFGSTALIWAARKGYLEIIEELLNAGAELDAVGMHSSTALTLATRGNHIKVVNTLLTREPNVNVVDNNGLSALGIAAREGYTEIAQALINSGAFVSTVDRFGNSILANAVRSGNIHLVRMLLEKHADVNCKDSENRTPLHLAIDKQYTDIVLALLEKKPNLELKNKDGDTALLRAVKNRDVGVCQLLVNMGAKLSATDNAGDNALHLALRAHSRRLTQTLLVNPSDSKLLYRPNKLGETPYSIDQEAEKPILPTIFGPIGTDMDLKNLLGSDAYSDVLADVVCEPNLSLPLTIGLYAKWGSGKSLLLPKIRDSMKSFSRSWLEGIELYWSWSVVFALLVVCSLAVLVVSAALSAVPVFHPLNLFYPLGIGLTIYAVLISAYGFLFYGSEVKLWGSSIATARFVARAIARMKIFLSVLTLNAPIRTDKDLVISPVSFLFADHHHSMSFIGGEQALTNIVKSLFISSEEHYGTLAVRLFSAFNSTHTHRNSKLQNLCGLPVVLYIMLMAFSFVGSLFFFFKAMQVDEDHPSRQSYLVTLAIFIGLLLISGGPPLYLCCVRLLLNLPKRRLNRISHKIHLLPFERTIQKLQKEVDLLTSLINTLDAFTNSQTRMVIMIDGLDSCEQNKMVQILDALTLFFSSRQNSPFIVLLAVDPHIIISAIQHSLRGGAGPNEITGEEYLKNIVTMPFFLDHTALKQLQQSLRNRSGMNHTASFRERKMSRSEFRGSRLSLRDSKNDGAVGNQIGSNDVTSLFPSFDYFSNMSPRTMRRIVNSIALTGRLLRTFEVDFSWYLLYSWISLIEQWPYRMSWLIIKASEVQDSSVTISELYELMKQEIVVDSNLAELDKSGSEFELILGKVSKAANRHEQLTVRQMRNFTACTSNLDPQLRKAIREQYLKGDDISKTEEEEINEEMGHLALLKEIGPAEFLFRDPVVWAGINKPLAKMSIRDVVFLVERLDIPEDRLRKLIEIFHANNLNGLVLQSCDLNDLKSFLQASLGDWTLLKLLIETLRKWKPSIHGRPSRAVSTAESQAGMPAISTQASEDRVASKNLLSIKEEDSNGFGTVAVDEVPVASDAEESSDEDSDSTKSIVGSNQSLLRRPSRHSVK
ncbi:KAP family p-loop domain-containing protein [Ditylenchus destructor]|nr:KAP family p-loop domain-containing protein [Ditylenchus destructor]